MSLTPASISEEAVREAMPRVAEALKRWLPASRATDRAIEVADAIRDRPMLTRAVAILGGEGVARATAWWHATSPFANVPAVNSHDGVRGGAAEIRGSAASMLARRDAEIQAFSDFTASMMDLGWEGTKLALPWIIAALRG